MLRVDDSRLRRPPRHIAVGLTGVWSDGLLLGKGSPAQHRQFCVSSGALTCRRSLLSRGGQRAGTFLSSPMDTDPPWVWQTLSSLQYQLAAVVWKAEKRKKGREVKENFDIYPSSMT